jgi:integrase
MRRTGSVIQRGRESWLLKFDVAAGPDGRRQTRRETVHAASRAEAQKMLNARLAERDTGTLVEPSAMTVVQAVEQSIAESRYVAKFDARAREILRLHIQPYFASRKLQSLTPGDIADWQAWLQKKGTGVALEPAEPELKRSRTRPLSAATLRQISKVLRRALRRETTLRRLPFNPAPAVALPKEERKLMTILTEAEFAALIPALRDDRRPTIARLALVAQCGAFSGAREAEILAMRWQDLDLATGRWDLQHSFEEVREKDLQPGDIPVRTRGNGHRKLVLRPCKTEASRRQLSLGPDLIALLTAHKRAQAERLLAQGHRVEPSDWVFDDGPGLAIAPNTISSTWGKAMRRLNFTPRIKFHALRHLYASYALDEGRSLVEIKDDLGHSLVQTTLTLYSHRLPNTRGVAATVEARLRAGRSRA